VDANTVLELIENADDPRWYSVALSKQQVEAIKKLPQSTKRLIRLLKLWSITKFKGTGVKKPPSYLFEIIAFDLTQQGKITNDLRNDLQLALTYILDPPMKAGVVFIADPVNADQNVAAGAFWPKLNQFARNLLDGKDNLEKLLA